jgi:hypothetical protein
LILEKAVGNILSIHAEAAPVASLEDGQSGLRIALAVNELIGEGKSVFLK